MRKVAVSVDGELRVHAAGVIGDYATICGLDGTDAKVGQRTETLPARAKIDCPDCLRIFRAMRALRATDFV